MAHKCFQCGEPVADEDALFGASGEAYCSEACRDAQYGPEE